MVIKPKRQLEPEQAAAAYEIQKHISVTAGPGSGKTTVLVERYLHILRERNLSIDQIVAITFTNRAANEMRERLRARLNETLLMASGDERKRWLGYKRTLDGAVITTIHGFCARLLREFPVEARVDPQFLLLDEHRAAMLLESVVEEALSHFISSGHIEISRLTLGVGRAKLAAARAQLYRDVRGQGLSLADLAMKTANSHSTEEDHDQSLIDLSRVMNDFLMFRRTTPAAKTNQAEVSSAWASLQSLVHSIPEPDGLADYCRSVESFRKLRPSASGLIKPHVTALDELLWEKNLLGRVPQICLDIFARRHALEMVMLLTHIDERLNEEKQKLSALDFDDLELRALELLARPEVVTRAAERYKFFLVDEFQDTNGLQRRLLERLALQKSRRESANLFIVGDRKQSIYGFRGADVDVFREMTESLTASGGEERPLLLNFRSQSPLIDFYNYLFRRLFQPNEEVTEPERVELGYVGHEPSEARRELRDSGPLVEVMITTEASGEGGERENGRKGDDPKAEQSSRELDAQQLAQRIIALTGNDVPAPLNTDNSNTGRPVQYSEIALLFRAMTNVQTYESVFRRANIPYQTVLGRGFYEREEIRDLIQLLRFLDNKTDELALAAVLRSPLVGISDNALLALRCAPWLNEVDNGDPLRHFTQTRKLFTALRQHRKIAFISDDEHELLDRAAALIKELVARRHHYPIGNLLRFAVDQSEFMTVIAATFDGAQRLANVQRLFTLAERFEQAGTHLIRDFVRYVEEFEAIGSRESEGQIDEATNAVRLMTIHQAKGLAFPIVIIPELQRYSRVPDSWVLLDRHRGLTLKVPDGRGKLVAGCTFNRFEQRHAWREQFESMRLLYVAATRAQDRLILSGTTKDFDKLGARGDTWLNWIWQTLELPAPTRSGIVNLEEQGDREKAQFELMLNVTDQQQESSLGVEPSQSTGQQAGPADEALAEHAAQGPASLTEAFPLLRPIEPERDRAVHRFSVTQLINYQRCSRQYYFDRVLHVPAADEMAVWNNAEAPEPPANLTATLKGAVIHRFCETYSPGVEVEASLRSSLEEVVGARQAELADRLLDIDREEALKELSPFARSYLSSDVIQRIERARKAGNVLTGVPAAGPGLWSELSFRLRRPLGILTGTIDKLLVSPSLSGNGFDIEIIDFKTNRIRNPPAQEKASTSSMGLQAPPLRSGETATASSTSSRMQARRLRSQRSAAQFTLDFSAPKSSEQTAADYAEMAASASPSLTDQVRRVASDYQLQMQAYALAVRELMPDLVKAGSEIKVTLHFLDPNVEFHLSQDLLETNACAHAIDQAFLQLISSRDSEHFPVRPATHCRMCNFLQICSGGREWIATAGPSL
ncbi:MAG: UvrD-helicase domain-containing protein [Pyrinomonadaceae bacterium]|nr:UvrD-helicase domain-containing protein [Pyrinomonadaceae bacterium]